MFSFLSILSVSYIKPAPLSPSASDMLGLRFGPEMAKTERQRGLDEATSPFSPAVAGLTSADSARHAASRHRPLHRAHAHFRFRPRSLTAAPTGRCRDCLFCRGSSRNRPSLAFWMKTRSTKCQFSPKITSRLHQIATLRPSSCKCSKHESIRSKRRSAIAIERRVHPRTRVGGGARWIRVMDSGEKRRRP